jgi:DNA mismatch repair protein MSH6
MQILVDDAMRKVTFLYKLEDGVSEGSFGMHCASMCGIPDKVVERAEEAAREWECTGRLKGHVKKNRDEEAEKGVEVVPLGWLSDVAWLLRAGDDAESEGMAASDLERGVEVLRRAVEGL